MNCLYQNFRNPLGFVILFIFANISAMAEYPVPAALQEHLDERIARNINQGLVVAIISPESTEYISAGTYGLTDNRMVDENTLFEIGSASMIFTSLLALELQEEGLLDLSGQVSQYIPEVLELESLKNTEITIGQLLTHQSGIPSLLPDKPMGKPLQPFVGYTRELFLENLGKSKLKFEPGKNVAASVSAYTLACLVIEKAAGESFDTVVKNHLLEPLEFEHTYLNVPKSHRFFQAKAHLGYSEVDHWDTSVFAGSVGYSSSAEDLAKLIQLNLQPGNSDLKKSLRNSQKIGKIGENSAYAAGYGWNIYNVEGRAVHWQVGYTAGNSILLGFDKKNQRGVVVLSNSRDKLDNLFFHCLLGDVMPLATYKPFTELSSGLYKLHAGLYKMDSKNAQFMLVTTEGGKLFAQINDIPSFRIFPGEDGKFFFDKIDQKIEFLKSEADKQPTKKARIFDGEKTIPATRVRVP